MNTIRQTTHLDDIDMTQSGYIAEEHNNTDDDLTNVNHDQNEAKPGSSVLEEDSSCQQFAKLEQKVKSEHKKRESKDSKVNSVKH